MHISCALHPYCSGTFWSTQLRRGYAEQLVLLGCYIAFAFSNYHIVFLYLLVQFCSISDNNFK
jgi:hypothetical protein